MRYFFAALFFMSCSLSADSIDCREDIQMIDEEIQILQDRKIKVLGKAELLEDQAVRWQFLPNQFNETRYSYARADAYRKEAKEIQERIDHLNKKKQKILEQNGITGEIK